MKTAPTDLHASHASSVSSVTGTCLPGNDETRSPVEDSVFQAHPPSHRSLEIGRRMDVDVVEAIGEVVVDEAEDGVYLTDLESVNLSVILAATERKLLL